jgi:hypothetical protein
VTHVPRTTDLTIHQSGLHGEHESASPVKV